MNTKNIEISTSALEAMHPARSKRISCTKVLQKLVHAMETYSKERQMK